MAAVVWAPSPPRFAAAGEVLPNLARAPPSPPHPRPVWALTQPPPPPCWAAGERLRPHPPSTVVPPPRRCSLPVPPLVCLATVTSTPCAHPLPRSGFASLRRRCSPSPRAHARPVTPWPRPQHALATPRRRSRPLVGLDSGWWAAGPWAPPVSLRAGWPWGAPSVLGFCV